jgi:phosphoserine phosphatase RsbX
MDAPKQTIPSIDWAWAGIAFASGESGDLHVVEAFAHGALIAVIDGLGHGPDAALAARTAAGILRAQAESPIVDLFEACHRALRKTRGAVMSVASLDARSCTLDCCGVGNVEGVLFRASSAGRRAREAVPTRGGVVGDRLPPLKVATFPVTPADVLVFATDGISFDFTAAVDLESEPQEIADHVLARHAKPSDDALVLVARFRGRAA